MRFFSVFAISLSCSACIAVGAPPPAVLPAALPDIEPATMQGMLASHNQVRASVGVPPLQWSGQMAAYAQQWAEHLAANNGCQMQHRSHANAAVLEAGENIYWASPVSWSDGRTEVQPITPSKVALDWASENVDYNYASNTCRPGAQCGHYTQMVWRTTSAVGCGMTMCGNKAQLWVCNYTPAGNWVGEKPY